ncbi:hypothetical protein GCM10010992_23230 [Cloacibacterium rupense]|uniref:DUF4252 domain-containing protein n=1 Tax=Cloacibacterium rupense TaxID=517423 RepID=A0ABQ2NNH1_9FLAO|nr:DUF4252 domain-containing protein [Cloacibacterium rupense]GGP05781.1 hypothetical protein GCM10010992_23230 [Cloacibacterium rupense]
MKLKYLLLLPILFFLQSCFVSEKSLYNEETKGNATITKVNVPMFLVKPYIKKALREDGESEQVINLIRKIRKVKVYTVENATEKMATQFSRQSFGSNLQELVSVNSKDSKLKIMSAITNSDTVIKDLLITVKDEKDLVYVKVLGRFSMDDIAKIAELSEKNKDSVANNN